MPASREEQGQLPPRISAEAAQKWEQGNVGAARTQIMQVAIWDGWRRVRRVSAAQLAVFTQNAQCQSSLAIGVTSRTPRSDCHLHQTTLLAGRTQANQITRKIAARRRYTWSNPQAAVHSVVEVGSPPLRAASAMRAAKGMETVAMTTLTSAQALQRRVRITATSHFMCIQ